MKAVNYFISAILYICSFQIYGQDFKEVKSAQDVIDNFITANGGAENLKQIKSIESKGVLNGKNENGKYISYISKDVFYVNFKSKNFEATEAYDAAKNKGWISLAGMTEDLTAGYIETFKISAESSVWLYYYEKEKHGISYALMPDDTIREIP